MTTTLTRKRNEKDIVEIIYSLVTFNDLPLAEYTSYVGTFKRHCNALAREVPRNVRYGTFAIENFHFHYLNSGVLLFSCLAHRSISQDTAFSFLNEFYMQFFTLFHDLGFAADTGNSQSAAAMQHEDDLLLLSSFKSFLPFEMNEWLIPRIRNLTKKYVKFVVEGTQLPPVALGSVGRQIVELESADLTLKIGCPLLVQSTRLASSSNVEVLTAASVKKTFFTANPYSMIWLCSALALIAFVYAVSAVFCGALFENCLSE